MAGHYIGHLVARLHQIYLCISLTCARLGRTRALLLEMRCEASCQRRFLVKKTATPQSLPALGNRSSALKTGVSAPLQTGPDDLVPGRSLTKELKSPQERVR